MKIVIITGGSSGIGEGLAKFYSQKGYKVFSIARGRSQSHDAEQIPFDLNQTEKISGLLDNLFQREEFKNPESLTLINNAGMLGEITTIENISAGSMVRAINLNFAAPMLLTSRFIHASKSLRIPKTIINISSGAAKSPYYGWSAYCTTKAAMDMMVRVVGKEQESQEYGVRVLSVYPGVVETAMQEQIRATDEKDFKDVQRFIELKEQGHLANPEEVAQKIFSIEANPQFNSGDIIDIRDL
jgi:benzil reductase ((S)-benzoin forming)